MKAIAYNCRGLGNQPAVLGLLELWKAKVPDVLFLSETKLDKEGMKRIQVLLNMPNMEVKSCDGRSGGLALLWKKDINLVVNPGMSRYHIDAVITGEDGFTWRLTGIYGEPQVGAREKTWKLLRILHGRSDLPWMCFGDFNEVLFASEKQGVSLRSNLAWTSSEWLWSSASWRTWGLLVTHILGVTTANVLTPTSKKGWTGPWPI
jgi:hypothetical protein